MKGYIKDYRQELQSDIWLMSPMYHRVWQFLKYMANHEARKIPMDNGSTLDIKPGQHLTSLRKIAAGVGYYEQGAWNQPNPKTIKRILDWLITNGMIETSTGHGNTRYTLITLIQWESYQSKDGEGNTKETASTQSLERNKNVKNDKNDKEVKPYKYIVEYLNTLGDSQFKHGARKTQDLIKARMNEGHTVEDFKTVIAYCCSEWKGKNFGGGILGDKYLRPSTLFNQKFNERLEQAKRKATDPGQDRNPFKAINGGKHDGLPGHDEQRIPDFAGRKKM